MYDEKEEDIIRLVCVPNGIFINHENTLSKPLWHRQAMIFDEKDKIRINR